MKIAKIILSVLIILFAALGIFRVLSFGITQPFMITSLATLILIRCIEYNKAGNKSVFLLMAAAALFCYAVVVYNVLIG